MLNKNIKCSNCKSKNLHFGENFIICLDCGFPKANLSKLDTITKVTANMEKRIITRIYNEEMEKLQKENTKKREDKKNGKQ